MKKVACFLAAMLLLTGSVVLGVEAPKPPVRIGALLAYTGNAAGTGQLFEKGIEIRLEEARWEIAGRKIILVKEDDASTTATALDKTRKLVERDKVDVVLGPLTGDVSLAVANFCASRGIPNVSYFNHSLKTADENKTHFMTGGSDQGGEVGFGRYAFEKQGFKKVSHLGPDMVATHALAEGFMKGFPGTAQKVWVPFGTIDYSPYFVTIKAWNPDCVRVFFLSPADALRFVKQYREFGMKLPLLFCKAETLDPMLQELGEKALGIYGGIAYTWTLNNDVNRRFVKVFKDKYGYKPSAFEAFGYMATSVFLETVKATKGDTGSQKLVEAMKLVSFNTPAGSLRFDDRVGIISQYVVKVGKVEGVYAWEVIDSYMSVR